jgi:hypothetical protein
MAAEKKYAVLALWREEDAHPCPGSAVASAWDDLRSVAWLRPLATKAGDKLVVSKDGSSGLAVYGPYLPLSPGRYRVTWRFSQLDLGSVPGDAPLIKVDVTDNAGRELLGERTITRKDVASSDGSEHIDAAINVTTAEVKKQVEMRVWRLAPVGFSIDAARLSVGQ